jgi:methyltransferase
MVTSVALYLAFLAALYGERLVELVISHRNARRALERGGVESGRGHYPVMVTVHALFPLACAAEVVMLHRRVPGALGFVALALALAAQGMRWWVVATLGERWCTRIVVVPGSEPVTRGPYRFLRHPNYAAVLVEAVSVPLIHGAWFSALIFFAANAALLAVRIPAEERALGATWTDAIARHRQPAPGAHRA